MKSKTASVGVVRGLCGALALLLILGPLAHVAFGAQSQDAAIIGQVTDESGAILPGVTVSATSPALQVPELIAVTNERGEYRLAPLPIGSYAVTYTLTGFQIIKLENVRLTVGFIAKLDQVLKVGALSETVTVSGISPIVDVTSTGTNTQLPRETLELLPSTRNGMVSLTAMAPAARGNLDVGGSQFADQPVFHAYGQDQEMYLTVEGIFTTTPNGSASGNYFDYSTFEEAQVVAISKGPAVPSRGLEMNVIVKSGGNDFHGGGFYSRSTPGMQGNNIDDKLKAQGLTNPATSKQWDVSGELGGRIVRDKLWFYGSLRSRELVQNLPGVSFPNGSPAYQTQTMKFFTSKGSYQMTPGNRFVGFSQRISKTWEGRDASLLVPWLSARSQRHPGGPWKVEWQHVKGNLVTSAQWGHWYYNPTYGAYTNEPSSIDLDTQIVGGAHVSATSVILGSRNHVKGTVGWYKSDWFLGNHAFNAGFDYMKEEQGSGRTIPPPGAYQLQFRSGVPFQIVTYNDPTNPVLRRSSPDLYVQDNWTIARRLTVNLGLRYAYDKGYVPAQCREAGPFASAGCINEVDFKVYNNVVPRFSTAFDVTGSGKSVIKAGYSRYNDFRDLGAEVSGANPFAIVTTTYRWRDLNGNRNYDPGEVNLDKNGPDFVTQGASALALPDPNQPQPRDDQYFVGLEHQLIPNMAVRIIGAYFEASNIQVRQYVNRPYSVYNIPVTNKDPGEDGRLGTADDPGTSFTYFQYPAAYAGSAFESAMQTSVPGAPHQTFKTIELGTSKRLSNGWMLNASYSATKKNIPYPNAAFDTPNAIALPNISDETWEWMVRASGAYVFPRQITASANFENRSGVPGARNVLFGGGTTVPTLQLNVTPIGSVNLPSIHVLDVRVEKAFRLRQQQRIKVELNMFNALNENTTTAWTTRSGARYLLPTSILPPRIFGVSATYTF